MRKTTGNRKETGLINQLRSKFNIEGEMHRERRVWVTVDKGSLIALCNFAKEIGFNHLSAISVTDWPENGIFELTYHIWSYSKKILLTIKTKIARANPSIDSVTAIWKENAQIHERELHELFGVEFKGNTDLAPLFLESWGGPPPFRKDFNWREYVRKEFYNQENEREKPYWQ
jgi:NADH-quinone oxidoreductase subunit C